MALFGIAKNNDGNMLEYKTYEEFNNFVLHISETLNVTFVFENKTQQFNYKDICKPLCDINEQFTKLMVINNSLKVANLLILNKINN